MSVLRLLINFTAGNDNNRNFLVADSAFNTFWSQAQHDYSDSELAERIVILLSQFIYEYEEELKTRAVRYFASTGWKDVLAASLLDNLESEMELLAEFAKAEPLIFTDSDLQSILRHGIGSDHVSIALHIVDDVLARRSSGIEIVERLYDFLAKSEVVEDSRLALAAVGSAFPDPNKKWSSVSLHVRAVKSENVWARAAAAIALGNCVSSKEDRAKLLSLIDTDDLLVYLLKTRFLDLVQFQAFHFFNNCMDSEMAKTVCSHTDFLLHHSRIMADNAAYNPPIGAVYETFLCKLIRLACIEGKPNPSELVPVWKLLFNLPHPTFKKVEPVLLQAYAEQGIWDFESDFQKLLWKNVLEIAGSVDATLLSSKLVAIGKSIQYGHIYVWPCQWLSDFLTSVHDGLQAVSETSASHLAISNNAKFIAARCLSIMDETHDNGQGNNARLTQIGADLSGGEDLAALRQICRTLFR